MAYLRDTTVHPQHPRTGDTARRLRGEFSAPTDRAAGQGKVRRKKYRGVSNERQARLDEVHSLLSVAKGSARVGAKITGTVAAGKRGDIREAKINEPLAGDMIKSVLEWVPRKIADTIPDRASLTGHVGRTTVGVQSPRVNVSTPAGAGVVAGQQAAAGVEQAGVSLMSGVARAPSQFVSGMAYVPAGAFYLAKDPVGTLKAMGEGVASDFRHPLQNSGYLASDLWGITGLARGGASRVGAALSEGTPAAAFAHRAPALREVGTGAFVLEPASPLGRDITRAATRAGASRTNRGVGRIRQQHANMVAALRSSDAVVLRNKARKMGEPETAALYSVGFQTPLETTRKVLAQHLAETDVPRIRTQLERKINGVNTAIQRGYVVGEAPNLAISPRWDKLAEVEDLLKRSSASQGGVRLEVGVDNPAGQAVALEKRVAAHRGQEHVPGTTDLTNTYFLTESPREHGHITGSMRRAGKVLGMPRQPPGMRAKHTGAAFRTGMTPSNIAKATAEREGTLQRYRTRRERWKVAISESLTAAQVVDAIEKGVLDADTVEKHWVGVRLRPGATAPAVQDVLKHWLDSDETNPGYLARSLKDSGKTTSDIASLAEQAQYADAAKQMVFTDGRRIGMRAFRGNETGTAVKIADTITQLAAFSALFGKVTGYINPNVAGNIGMTTVHGALPTLNMVTLKAIRTVRALGARDALTLRIASGAGGTRAITEGRKGLSHALDAAYSKVGGAYSAVIDDYFRVNIMLTELQQLGYKTIPQLKAVIEAGRQIPADATLESLTKAQQDFLAASKVPDRALGAFRNMSDVERDVVRRVIWFYPVLKGLADYTARLPVEHPAKSAVLVQMGRVGQDRTEAILGNMVAKLLLGVFPIGGFQHGMPDVADPRSASVTGTLAEFAAFADDPARFIRDRLTPGLALPLVFLGFNPRGYSTDTRPLQTRLQEFLLGFVPGVSLAKRLTMDDKTDPDRLYWYSDKQAVGQFVGGSPSPRTLNMTKASQKAAEQFRSPNERAADKVNREIRDARRYLNGPDEKRVVAALKRQAAIQDATKNADLYKQRLEITVELLSRWHPRLKGQLEALAAEASSEDEYSRVYNKLLRWAYVGTLTAWHHMYDTETGKRKNGA